jgi:protein-tyrosine-phosphatase
MNEPRSRASISIALLAIGYFACYVPYSALTKAVTSGLWPGLQGQIPGFRLLPASVIATVVCMLSITTAMGWWRAVSRRKVLGLELPIPGRSTFLAGLCTAVIIGTTTLAYSLSGSSIVFMLLLLRGGVLMLAPLVDFIYKHRVPWVSWGGFFLSMLATGIALSESWRSELSWMAVVDVTAYLTGYFFRLQLMSRFAKTRDHRVNLRYFAEEHLVASPALLVMLAFVALLGWGEVGRELRLGFTTFLLTPEAVPAVLVGVLYEALFVFGTWIYLYPSEHTFSIPVNRSSSLLAGVAAMYGMAYLVGTRPPSAYQLGSAALILVAIFLWSSTSREVRHAGAELAKLPQRLLLFVCAGNTCRSPIAEAHGWDEIGARFGRSEQDLARAPVQVLSAGTSAQLGKPMSEEAMRALHAMGVRPRPHQARQLTPDMVASAEVIFCVTRKVRDEVIRTMPQAADKTHCLDPEQDIPDPHGREPEVYLQVVTLTRALVRRRFDELGLRPQLG